MIRRLLMLALAVSAMAPGWGATAQTATRRIRGTITALDGATLTVRSRDDEVLRVQLAPGATISAVVPATLADAKPGTFIGTAATGPKDHLRAVEVHIFPEAMRGTGEGHRPWDLMPESTMTNATITSESAGTDGHDLVLAAKGEALRVTVPDGTPIVTYAPGDATLLRPGAKVSIGAQEAPDGTLTTSRVAVGKDGLTPPM